MSASRRITAFLCLTIAYTAQCVGGEAEDGNDLAYKFSAGVTNVYRLEIESQAESGREAMTGTVIVATKQASSSRATLMFKVQMRPKPLAGQPGYPGFFRPGGPLPLMSLFGGMAFESREMVLDNHGRPARLAGDLPFPVPLGSLMTALFPRLPEKPAATWEDQREVWIMDEPMMLGPLSLLGSGPGAYPMMSYGPSRNVTAALAATMKEKCRRAAAGKEGTEIERTISLDSVLNTGNEPRISATAQGKVVLNGADGWPGKAELECKSVAVTENVNRRTGLKITWERLEGAERDTALAPPPPVRPPTEPTPAQDLAKIEQRLRSDQAIERELAANELNNARIQDPSPDFMALMVKLSGERNDTVRQAAIGVIAKHGTAEQVPLLVKALKDPANASSRQTIARGLGRLKDPRGADPLAEMMALGVGDNTSYRSPRDGENFWVEALVEIGPASEKAVLPLLKEKSIDTRIQVCAVLKQVGTRRSLADLKDLTASPSKELSEAAAEAVRSIQAKESK